MGAKEKDPNSKLNGGTLPIIPALGILRKKDESLRQAWATYWDCFQKKKKIIPSCKSLMVKCWFCSFRFGFVYSRVLNWVLIPVGESVGAYLPVTFPIGGGRRDDVKNLLDSKRICV